MTILDKIEIKKLKAFDSDEGRLFETLRSDDVIFSGEFGQNVISIVEPDTIKGLHFHGKTEEYLTCIKGNIVYVVIDGTNKENFKMKKFYLGEENLIMIKTPPGIWHGFKPLNNKGATILYTMNIPYNSEKPDQKTLPVDHFGDIWY